MKRIMLVVSYDGTDYCGWQKQKNGMSVEETLNRYISDLVGEDIEIIGASRTDAGVHAKGNVAVFDTDSSIPPEKFAYALNSRLPEDIRIRKSKLVDKDFHPRYNKAKKKYVYKILNSEMNIPIYRMYTKHIAKKLDIDKMRKAAGYLVGQHDFKSFCAVNTGVKSTVRNIHGIDISKSDDEIVFITVEGNGFLYNMVRIIVGTLVQVGLGRMEPSEVLTILNKKDRKYAGPTIEAKGLILDEIFYEE